MPNAADHWKAAERAAEGRQGPEAIAQGFLHMGLAVSAGWFATQGSSTFWNGLDATDTADTEPTEARMCEATNHEGKRCRRVIHDQDLSHETAGGYSWYSPTEG